MRSHCFRVHSQTTQDSLKTRRPLRFQANITLWNNNYSKINTATIIAGSSSSHITPHNKGSYRSKRVHRSIHIARPSLYGAENLWDNQRAYARSSLTKWVFYTILGKDWESPPCSLGSSSGYAGAGGGGDGWDGAGGAGVVVKGRHALHRQPHAQQVEPQPAPRLALDPGHRVSCTASDDDQSPAMLGQPMGPRQLGAEQRCPSTCVYLRFVRLLKEAEPPGNDHLTTCREPGKERVGKVSEGISTVALAEGSPVAGLGRQGGRRLGVPPLPQPLQSLHLNPVSSAGPREGPEDAPLRGQAKAGGGRRGGRPLWGMRSRGGGL